MPLVNGATYRRSVLMAETYLQRIQQILHFIDNYLIGKLFLIKKPAVATDPNCQCRIFFKISDCFCQRPRISRRDQDRMFPVL